MHSCAFSRLIFGVVYLQPSSAEHLAEKNITLRTQKWLHLQKKSNIKYNASILVFEIFALPINVSQMNFLVSSEMICPFRRKVAIIPIAS